MTWEIFKFELRYHLRQPLFWIIFVIFFLMTFGAVTSDGITIGGSLGNVNRNAPFVIMQLVLVMGIVFGVFTTTAFGANAAHRDFEMRTDALFFSAPIKKRDYLIGRFLGSYVISVLIFMGVTLAIAVGSKAWWLEKERIGPFELAPYAFSLFVLIAPTLLLVSAIAFGVAALSRSMMATYSAMLLFFAGYFASLFLTRNNLDREKLYSLLDPFAFRPFALSTRYWTVFERNHNVLPVEGVFLWNRLLWIGVALVVFLATLLLFRFETGTRKSRKKLKAETVDENAHPITLALPKVSQSFNLGTWLQQLRSTARLEVSSVVRSIPFVVVLLLAVFNVASAAGNTEAIFGADTYPVTHLMITAIQGSYQAFVLILISFYAGEIVWRERQLKLNEVTDSMPTPTSVLWLSKYAAVVVIVLCLLAAGMLTTIVMQLANGYKTIEWPLYFQGVFLFLGVPALLTATLAFVLQTLTNNKYVGLLAMVVYFVGLNVLPAVDFQHFLYRFGDFPDAAYSDMNGWGHYITPLIAFYVFWSLFAGLLVLTGHLLWVRGTDAAMKSRLRIARDRFGKPAFAALVVLFVAFLSTGCYIYYNTNVLNEYRTSDDNEKLQAEFEKKYKKYELQPLPRITDVKADVDIFPNERAVEVRGSYQMTNKNAAPLNELHVWVSPRLDIVDVKIPGATVKQADKEHGYTIYTLAQPMQPGASLPMNFRLRVENKGFPNAGANTDIVANGTFINNVSYFPHLGYFGATELQDRNTRRKYGLPAAQRLPKIDDPRWQNVNQLTGESDFINLDTTVSTSADQIAIAPGYLQKEWTANGRRYFHYKTTSPILGFWSYLSARYTVKKDNWKGIPIEVYYDAKHPYNVDRMIQSIKKSLDYFTTNFSPYQHQQVRIIEFPRYQRFAQAFPNTIPYSEAIGFIADLREKEKIDYVFYVTAHEIAHQWWAHQVVGSRVQGTTMITETMAQYSALMVMEKEYGKEKMRRFLRYELNQYLAGRGGELVAELPLMLVENQPYIHYRKGSLVMYALKDAIGEEKVNQALKNVVAKWGFKSNPYPTTRELVNEFRAVAAPEQQSLITDLFETITLFDNKATDVTWTKRPDGRYAVKMTVESKKLRADGEGNEKPVAIDDWIDVAVLGPAESQRRDAVGKILFLEKRRITQPKTTFDFVVNEEPKKAGIDPFNKLVDRNPDDNTKAATKG